MRRRGRGRRRRTNNTRDSRNRCRNRCLGGDFVGGRDVELTVDVHHGEFDLVAFGLDIGVKVSVKIKEDGSATLDDQRRFKSSNPFLKRISLSSLRASNLEGKKSRQVLTTGCSPFAQALNLPMPPTPIRFLHQFSLAKSRQAM